MAAAQEVQVFLRCPYRLRAVVSKNNETYASLPTHLIISRQHSCLDLFSQAVEMSGSILAPWGISDNAAWLTNELLTHLGHPALRGKEAKEFLKNVSSQDVENALKKVKKGVTPKRLTRLVSDSVPEAVKPLSICTEIRRRLLPEGRQGAGKGGAKEADFDRRDRRRVTDDG